MAIPTLTWTNRLFRKAQRDLSYVELTNSEGGKAFAQLTADAAMGEVTSAPAANTLLGRLRTIATTLAAGIPGLGWGWTTSFGIDGAAFNSADQSGAVAAITSAPAAGLKLVVDSVLVTAGATAQICSLTEETSGTLIAKISVPANSSFNWKPEGKVKLATALKKLMIQSSAAGDITATAVYHTEA